MKILFKPLGLVISALASAVILQAGTSTCLAANLRPYKTIDVGPYDINLDAVASFAPMAAMRLWKPASSGGFDQDTYLVSDRTFASESNYIEYGNKFSGDGSYFIFSGANGEVVAEDTARHIERTFTTGPEYFIPIGSSSDAILVEDSHSGQNSAGSDLWIVNIAHQSRRCHKSFTDKVEFLTPSRNGNFLSFLVSQKMHVMRVDNCQEMPAAQLDGNLPTFSDDGLFEAIIPMFESQIKVLKTESGEAVCTIPTDPSKKAYISGSAGNYIFFSLRGPAETPWQEMVMDMSSCSVKLLRSLISGRNFYKISEFEFLVLNVDSYGRNEKLEYLNVRTDKLVPVVSGNYGQAPIVGDCQVLYGARKFVVGVNERQMPHGQVEWFNFDDVTTAFESTGQNHERKSP